MIQSFNPDSVVDRVVDDVVKRMKERAVARTFRGMGKSNMAFQMALMTRMIEEEGVRRMLDQLQGPFVPPDKAYVENSFIDYAVMDGALYRHGPAGWVKAYDFGAQNVVASSAYPAFGGHRIASLDYNYCYLPVGYHPHPGGPVRDANS